MRFSKLAVCCVLAVVALGPTGNSVAQQRADAVQIDVRSEIAAALYAASATQAAAERLADARLRAARAEIARLRAQGASALADLTAAQEAYVADLSLRDRTYAQEIAVFRAAVADIAAVPEGARGLVRFNAGDEIGALAILDRLVDARERARQVRVNIETAADRRRVATLALEARARGRLDTGAVITRYEEVTRLDPGEPGDWIELGKLYQDAGGLVHALTAFTHVTETAPPNTRAVAVALYYVALVREAMGDLPAARVSLERALEIDRAIAVATPNSMEAQRDVAVDLGEIGDVLFEQGNRASALDYYQQHFDIVEF